MTHSEPGAVPRRPHHISSIAHLFLQENGPKLAGQRTGTRAFAVAAPGTSPVAAFAATGLAVQTCGQAYLAEDTRLLWSARTFLQGEGEHTPPGSARQELDRNLWEWADKVSSDGQSPVIHWNHLGCLDRSDLMHMESLTILRKFGPIPAVGPDGLVWCLLAGEAASLSASYILGRLVELLQPGRLDILVFPDAWARFGRPGWQMALEAEPNPLLPAVDLEQCRELATRVCHPLTLRVHPVLGNENRTESISNSSFWSQVVSEMTGGHQA